MEIENMQSASRPDQIIIIFNSNRLPLKLTKTDEPVKYDIYAKYDISTK